MKLTIRTVGTGAHPNLRTYQPENPEIFAEFVVVEIGPKNHKGGDEFVVQVVTPGGLAELEDRDGVIAQGPLLVLRQYDFDLLFDWLQRTVSACEADDWKSSIEKLKRYFRYEFEFMQSKT